MPPLIRALGLSSVSAPNAEEKQARRAIVQAALNYLEETRRKDGTDSAEVYEDLAQHYRHRMATLNDGDGTSQEGINPEFYRGFVELSRELIGVERRTAIQLRNERRISDELLRELEHELDLGEARLTIKG